MVRSPYPSTPHWDFSLFVFARATSSKDIDTCLTLNNDATPKCRTCSFLESKIPLKCVGIELQIAVKLDSQCCNPSNVSYLGIYHDFPSLRRLTTPTELDPAGARSRVHHTSIKDQRDLPASPRVPHACATLGMGTAAPIGWE